MDTELIEWLNSVANTPGESLGCQPLDQLILAKTYCWAKWVKGMINPITANLRAQLGLSAPGGLLLVGPQGNGRHSIAEGTAETLLKRNRHPYCVIHMSGVELEQEDQEIVIGALGAALESQRLCLILEHIMDCSWYRPLTQKICELIDENEGEDKFFPILIEDRERDIPPDLMKRMQLLPFRCPTEKERESYLKDRILHQSGLELSGVTEKDLAKSTEGFSYRQLSNLMDFIRLNQVIDASAGSQPISRYEEDLAQLRDFAVTKEAAEQIIDLLKSTAAPAAASAPVVVQQVVGAAAAFAAVPQATGSDKDTWASQYDHATYEEQKKMLAAETEAYRAERAAAKAKEHQ